MSEWTTYTLSDLLMFSARTYYRLIELYNLAVWPLHLLAIFAGMGIVLCALRNDGGRIAAVVLGLCWLWVAWAFHAERYATINSAAVYFAAGFAIQGVLLIFAGRVHTIRNPAGVGLVLLALFAYPLLAVIGGRAWQQGEVFGIAPDPTAALTLVLLAFSPRSHWALWPVPLLWSAISGATLWTMHVRDAWVLPLLALLALVALIRRRRLRSGREC